MATQRRIVEELGFNAPLNFLFKFQYFAKYKTKGSEREICSVFAGISNGEVTANPHEIAEWYYIDLPELEKRFEQEPDSYSPWFTMEWERIKEQHLQDIKNMIQIH
jgi:isopentenyl-diphosphate delta-isomerase